MITKLPKGYDTTLGRWFDEGYQLSGGEWQKVALARAFMRDAEILILDEPTASLDARAEYEIFAHMKELTEGKMAVFISHRFSTVRLADRIFVLEDGTINEAGSHQSSSPSTAPMPSCSTCRRRRIGRCQSVSKRLRRWLIDRPRQSGGVRRPAPLRHRG